MNNRHRRVLASSAALALAVLSVAGQASAAPSAVGERHMTAPRKTASLRDAQQRDDVAVTVWYPAVLGAMEAPLYIGPPGAPFFKSGAAATNATILDQTRRPVILLSHGFGGSARMMGWFGTSLARRGYIVVAVDHPGNNSDQPMTAAGAVLYWERPGDLAAALERVRSDPSLGPLLDLDRLGVAGFSAGGYTALAAAGGRANPVKLQLFCRSNPSDGVCLPQSEHPVSAEEAQALLARSDTRESFEHAGDDVSIQGVKAVFVMAPAIVQAFDPASLERIHARVQIILGEDDTVAPPRSNGDVAASLITGARRIRLAGVGHYDFLASCTPAGEAALPICQTRKTVRPARAAAVDSAIEFFDRTLVVDAP